ncbi:MAG: hypothetical protein MJE63_25290 [Proteobacteria bacterium]|nr:hypothetical protein [Pseudomonadota bacterium]
MRSAKYRWDDAAVAKGYNCWRIDAEDLVGSVVKLMLYKPVEIQKQEEHT